MMSGAAKKLETTAPAPGADPATDASVVTQLAQLKRMSVKQLRDKWEQLFGTPPVNYSRANLELRIGYRIQELTYGGLPKNTRRMLDMLADEVEGKATGKAIICDPRNPVVGTRLLREWDNVEHTVTVATDGYEWQGRKYKSLSAIARAITGVQWNGWRFFGLRESRRGRQ
jgi:hypothetical protein